MSHVRCEGWWEQFWYGRQPMEQLELWFEGAAIRGSGSDIIGPFTFVGRLEHNRVSLVKRYLGRHSVNYLGSYDGEGTFQGVWSIPPFEGPWLIRIISTIADETASEDAIHEVRPMPSG